MTGTKQDLIHYRLERAKETLDDAKILAKNEKWNSAINRLYYAAYYAVAALLLKHNHNVSSHNGAKSLFSAHFIKTKQMPAYFGKMYSQLFTWRQKGDYADFFDFTAEKVMPYFEPVEQLISHIEKMIKS